MSKIRRRQRCPKCGSLDIIRWGTRNNHQRYKCSNCGSSFIRKQPSVSSANRFIWFRKWVLGKQTIQDIAEVSGYSERHLHRWFDDYLAQSPKWEPDTLLKLHRLLIIMRLYHEIYWIILYFCSRELRLLISDLRIGQRKQKMCGGRERKSNKQKFAKLGEIILILRKEVDDILRDYGYYLKIERAMSSNTVAAYLSDAGMFLSNGETGGECKSLTEITSSDIVSYIDERTESDAGLSKRSQARLLSSLRSFFNWLILEGVIKENPCDTVDSPKLGRHLPAVLSIEEVERIIDSVRIDTWNGLRDRALLEVLYDCGLRVSEAVSLKISDVFFNDGFVRIIGKGNKQRVVPVCDIALSAIEKYMEVRPSPSDSESRDILFLNKNGRRLTRVYVFNMVKRCAMAAGISKEISPHTFRHSFATHLIGNGADLRIVQEMLGHESILTTEIYTHVDKSTWQSAVMDHHPRK